LRAPPRCGFAACAVARIVERVSFILETELVRFSRRDRAAMKKDGEGGAVQEFREVDRAIDSSLLLCFLIAERDPRMTARRFSTGHAGD